MDDMFLCHGFLFKGPVSHAEFIHSLLSFLVEPLMVAHLHTLLGLGEGRKEEREGERGRGGREGERGGERERGERRRERERGGEGEEKPI